MEAIGNGAALLVQQEINNAVSQDTGTAADVKDITEHPEPEQEEEEEIKAEDEDREEEKRVEEEKEIELEQEQELEPETEPLVEEEEAEPGRFTSHYSPDRYFSPRRDKEVPEGIVSEGLSSEYNLPRHEHVKEGEYDKVVVEEKNPTGLEKEEELRKRKNDSAPDEVGQLREVSNKVPNAELKFFLEVEFGLVPVSKISNVRSVSLPIGGRSFPSLKARRFQVSCAVEIVMGLEEEFGISVEEESAQSITTVQEAADMIEKLIEKN